MSIHDIRLKCENQHRVDVLGMPHRFHDVTRDLPWPWFGLKGKTPRMTRAVAQLLSHPNEPRNIRTRQVCNLALLKGLRPSHEISQCQTP